MFFIGVTTPLDLQPAYILLVEARRLNNYRTRLDYPRLESAQSQSAFQASDMKLF